MSKEFKPLKGMQDLLPDTLAAWQFLEREFFSLSRLYGYGEIRTPVLEEQKLFDRTAGETSEVVTKQMYAFPDKKGRPLAMKPEGTAGVVRALLNGGLVAEGRVTRVCYQTQIWRYEQPQAGRYRQAHQFGFELIGSRSPEAELEIIELTTRFYQSIGLTDTVVLLNSIGDTDTRASFGARVLEQVAPWLATLPAEEQERVRKNPMRLLDSKDPAVQELVSDLPPIHTFLSDASQAHFAAVQAGLSERGIAFRIDPTIVRGLDYYNDCVFEIHSQFLGAQGALCGGGRYDGLMKQLGGPNIPCVGVGMGVERALIVLEQVKGLPVREPLTAFVIAFGEAAQVAARSLVATLRAEGIPAQCALGFGSPKQQFKQADQSGARFAIIIGDDELASGTLSLKNLATAEQQTLPAGEIVHTLKK